MANKKKQFDQEFKQNAVNYCLTHPELSRKECAKNLGIGDSTLYRWKQEAKANNKLSASITDELIKMKEAEARLKHGWVTVQGSDTVVTDAKEK